MRARPSSSRRVMRAPEMVILATLLVPQLATTFALDTSAPPDQACQARLDHYCNCNAHCNSFPQFAPLVALRGLNRENKTEAWRCYPAAELTPDHRHFVADPGRRTDHICTRPAELEAILSACSKPAAPTPCPAPPSPQPLPSGSGDVEVFAHGMGGYPCIRTPSLITTSTGSLLAFAGTRARPGDGCVPTIPYNSSFDHQDNVMRKSTDHGKSWGALVVVSTAPGWTVRNHGAAVWDSRAKQVVLVLQVAPDDAMAVMTSTSEGQSWSQPRRLTALGDDITTRVSPGRGLQLSTSHKYASRLLFVAQKSTNAGNVVFYSDDGASTWTKSPTTIEHCNEAQMVELQSGTLLLNARDEDHKNNASVASGARRFSTSTDGGHTWQALGALRDDLGKTNCMGSFLGSRSDPSTLLYSHPYGRQRTNGTVWRSTDQAKTFHPAIRVTPKSAADGFAYSCLTDLSAMAQEAEGFGLLYETGDPGRCNGPSCRILFQRFALDTGTMSTGGNNDLWSVRLFLPKLSCVARVTTTVYINTGVKEVCCNWQ